jgi:gamma-glutamylcyclotransferase (GGCT)/AIG2-like uncharacterized protein YtfP
MTKTLKLAVNGTLMKGLELNENLLNVGATFVQETQTEAAYKLFSINDVHPAMLRVPEGGVSVAVEVWSVPLAGLSKILTQEPAGLAIGKVKLDDGEIVLGVIGESICCDSGKEITEYGGWRDYIKTIS